MSAHHIYSPSKGGQWINCHGSMTFAENRTSGDSSTFADNGTASHTWSGDCLKLGVDADHFLNQEIVLNGETYTMDDERAMFCQVYLDYVRDNTPEDRIVELRLDMKPFVETTGTADAAGYDPLTKTATVIDLKYGVGERVWAKRNAQGMLYALGYYNDLVMMGETPLRFKIVIVQPRLDHIDDWTCTLEELMEFAKEANAAIQSIEEMLAGTKPITFNPDTKTCRWCKVANCAARTAKVAADVAADFDVVTEMPLLPSNYTDIATAYAALPFVEQWVKAMKKDIWARVLAGEKIIGGDGQPLKFVEGGGGKRAWVSEALAEQSLPAILGPKAYQPQKIITAPAAAKLLDKKKSEQTWKLLSENIKKGAGKPVLAWGSDTRPAYSGNVATADDFEDIAE